MPSPHHLLQSLRLYRITSSVMYFTSELVCTLWSRACQILSEFSEAMNAAYVLCMAFRFSWTICDDSFIDSAGRVSDRMTGNLGLVSRTSWNGEKPATFWRLFLHSMPSQSKIWGGVCFSYNFVYHVVRVWLFLPTTSLLHGDSTSVVCTVIPRWFAISRNSLLANSTPLSVRNFWRVL